MILHFVMILAYFLLQQTFESGLIAFEQDGIHKITCLKDKLLGNSHAQSVAIKYRHELLLTK